MLRFNLKIAIRNLQKYWKYTVINILGLAIGLASFIFIILYIYDELRYDHFHEKADRIYRINRWYNAYEASEDAATCSFPCGPALLKDNSDLIENMVRFFDFQATEMLFEHYTNDSSAIRFNEKNFYLADSTVFEVFTFPLLEGSPQNALKYPNTIVLSESTAKRYFGDESPTGKIIRLEETVDMVVTGVMKDIPSQSHFKIDMLGSLSTYRLLQGKPVHQDLLGALTLYRQTKPNRYPETWIWNPCWTYVLLRPGIEPWELDERMPEFYSRHYKEFNYQNITLYPQAIKDIHLKSDHAYEMQQNSNIEHINILAVIAIIVLFLACINYMNITTAFASERAREIGMKKVFGGQRSQLTWQFIGESVIECLIGMLIAVILVELFLPFYNNFTEKSFSLFFVFRPNVILSLISLAILVGIFAGIYPALFLSSYKPVDIIKGKPRDVRRAMKSRKVLVLAQFTISITLTIGTIIAFAQLRYLRNAELGYETKKIILLRNSGGMLNQYYAFKKELLQNPDIKNVTGMEDILGVNHNTRAYQIEGLEEGKNYYVPTFLVDWDFTETFEIEIIEGRSFSRQIPDDINKAVLINERMARDLGWSNKEAIGKKIISQYGDERVIGVYRNFYASSLHNEMDNFIIDMYKDPGNFARIIAVNYNNQNQKEVINFIQSAWKKYVPNRPFEYETLSTYINDLYFLENKFGNFTLMLTILAIIIACLGMIGLTLFLATQKTKDICIRRVNGATMPGIFKVMFNEFSGVLIYANIISWIGTFFIAKNWLSNYAEHTSINLWIFLAAGIITLTFSLLIIGYRAMKCSSMNLADILRY